MSRQHCVCSYYCNGFLAADGGALQQCFTINLLSSSNTDESHTDCIHAFDRCFYLKWMLYSYSLTDEMEKSHRSLTQKQTSEWLCASSADQKHSLLLWHVYKWVNISRKLLIQLHFQTCDSNSSVFHAIIPPLYFKIIYLILFSI